MTDQTTALTEAIIEQYDSTKKARKGWIKN